ncbi:hypothetical protein NC653_000759 [Populus alba x Populus x berolinensis]|uniref:Uncharacterized protein n=1 Tax=Populus alba x Populus x berolinensis TaxID=444605 RepID=A0AAD6RL83_9ROSI|nr:hypothetical protein NC653_000759 [Populus alba x Populus x berolinensis]
MYSHDMKRRLMDEDVSRVLAFLKVSADIMFETGIESCLECLEAIPWSEDEEEKVVTQLSQLQLCDLAAEVLQRDHPWKIWSKEMKGTGDGEEKSLARRTDGVTSCDGPIQPKWGCGKIGWA